MFMLPFFEATWPVWLVFAVVQMLAWHYKYRDPHDQVPDAGPKKISWAKSDISS